MKRSEVVRFQGGDGRKIGSSNILLPETLTIIPAQDTKSRDEELEDCSDR